MVSGGLGRQGRDGAEPLPLEHDANNNNNNNSFDVTRGVEMTCVQTQGLHIAQGVLCCAGMRLRYRPTS